MQIFERRFEMDYPVIDIEGTGTHIRDLIRESGHTVTEVSEYLGTSTSLVYRYIRGEVLPSIDRIVASGPNAQMILVSLAPEMMVGLAEAPSTAQQKYFPDYYVDMPTLGQFYGKKMSLNLENLMQTDTQIIIDVGEIQEDGNEEADRHCNDLCGGVT